MLRPLFWGQFEDKGSKVVQLCFLSLPLPLRPWPASRAPVFLQGHKGGLLGFSIHLSLTDKGAEVPRDPHWEGSHGVCLTGQGPWAASSAPRQADGVRTGSSVHGELLAPWLRGKSMHWQPWEVGGTDTQAPAYGRGLCGTACGRQQVQGEGRDPVTAVSGTRRQTAGGA